ncbi:MULTISPECIES: hypothetical protein [unclassified Streptomyces]|uniref:hypothetical protein n=1 Tax=unclassified Streptomyces TaxID=2593676 RepID=UPI003684F982
MALPVRGALDQLPVRVEDRTGYERSKFKHWVDADKDGCNTRQEVLKAEAVIAPEQGPCCALSGRQWYSPYDVRRRDLPPSCEQLRRRSPSSALPRPRAGPGRELVREHRIGDGPATATFELRAADKEQLTQLATDVENLVRVVNQLTLENRQLRQQLATPVRLLPAQPQPPGR